MTKLISEQLPNDGGYYAKQQVNEANARLKQIGRQGKRATIKVKGNSLTLVFTYHDGKGNPQKNVGLGAIPVSAKGIEEAEVIARSVTKRLVSGKFDWDWFNDLIGKDTSEQTKQLTCKEMVEQYKKHYFKQREGNKSVKSGWYIGHDVIEKKLGNLEEPLSLSLVREVIETKENNSNVRAKVLNGLAGLLKYFDNTDYKKVIKDYKANNNPRPKKRNVPNDKRIIEVYETGFVPTNKTPKRYVYRYPQWQFLYGLLATYGLRVHEAWNIANWDEPVTLKNGDWLTIDVDDDDEISLQCSGGDMIIPAILDPNNKEYILCIKHATKTGYRMAMPLSPEGHDWIEEFNLLQPLNLPDVKDSLGKFNKNRGAYRCTDKTGEWFRNRKYGFAPHDLRHALNHRGHLMGYNPKALADSLGHSMKMNSTGYLRHMSDNVKLQGIRDAMAKEQNKRSENEILKEEIEALKAEVELLKTENELLKTKLQLNQTFTESKSKK